MNEDKLIDDSDIWEDEEDHSIMKLIRWWESKRLRYNIYLLIAGAIGLLLGGGLLILFRYQLEGLILGILFYALLVNVCYTAGWVFELFLKAWNISIPALSRYRNSIFWIATIGSILLTFFFGIGASFLEVQSFPNF